jgi:hypothetical protein
MTFLSQIVYADQQQSAEGDQRPEESEGDIMRQQGAADDQQQDKRKNIAA